ncbi:hypothetical protein N9955_00685 [bacterium]|nr:hypothetical protein [bacterium]
MTIKELKEKKETLRKDIWGLIETFVGETGVDISDVCLKKDVVFTIYGEKKVIYDSVDIELSI